MRNQIAEIGIRKVARESNVNRETVAMIARGGRVKASTLAGSGAAAPLPPGEGSCFPVSRVSLR
jgi:hypothetical protein